MDRKSFLVLLACAGLFALWVALTPRLYPPVQRPAATNTPQAATAGTPAANGPGTPAPTPTLAPATPGPAAAMAQTVTSLTPPPGAPEETLLLTNGTTRYRFTSHGGGLQWVEFDEQRYPETVRSFSGRALTNRPASLNRGAPHPLLALVGLPELEGDGIYRLTRTTRTNTTPRATNVIHGVRAEKLLSSQVQIIKEFELGSNYQVTARTRILNRGTQALALPPLRYSAGAALPENLRDDGQHVGYDWQGPDASVALDRTYFEPTTLGCFPGTPRNDYQATNVVMAWIAARNQFFFQAVIPGQPAAGVEATRRRLPPPPAAAIEADRRAHTNQFLYAATFSYPSTNLAAGAEFQQAFTLIAAPKEYHILEGIGAQFQNGLDSKMGYRSLAIFEFFARALLLAMNLLHSAGLSFALAIITITVLIKLLFWPLTQAQMRSMKRMADLAPQIKAIQEKYKDDREKLQRKTMELYREHKVNPVSGCLPMLVQIPVFIGFFTMVGGAIELRGATFLWALDLSKPDTVAVLSWLNFLPWPLTWLHNFPVNPLSIIMGVTMWLQTRLTPMSPGVDPTAQKMMRYMPLFFLVILYNYSAGLTLYWTVQNLLSVLQTKLTKAQEAREAALAKTAPAVAATPAPNPGPRRRR
ncbi:MAG: hypothetical protein RJA22_1895 [Verrucomicrobiota bacterium]|jgi:YidC/Oxa1 family membrane protein insertase